MVWPVSGGAAVAECPGVGEGVVAGVGGSGGEAEGGAFCGGVR